MSRNRQTLPFALMLLVSALFGSAILATMVWKAETLARYGLAGNFYYVALLLFGLSVAGILFGFLQSYASYTGKHFGGLLKLGGPVVACFLAVVLGFVLVPNASTFAVTIFVHGPAGHQDVVARNKGEVVLNLGPDAVVKPIGEQGQAFFPAVPSSFRGQELYAAVRSAEYETAADERIILDSNSVYLAVRKKSGRIAGRVQDLHGNPIPGAVIQVADLSVSVDPSNGHFELVIPGERMKSELELTATAPTYAPARHYAVPGGNDMVITLIKAE